MVFVLRAAASVVTDAENDDLNSLQMELTVVQNRFFRKKEEQGWW